MLGAKTILLAATVALALGQSDAAAESRLRVRIHGKGSTCGSGQSPMSVEGVEGVFCVSGQSCVADIDGSCPGEQTGLPYGSYCGIVKTGVHGCMPYTEPQGDSADSAECGDGESPMSVEGVEGIFCVSGQACVADINGTCPGVQDGLPYGSSCGIVKTGVHGCKPNSRHHHKKHHHKGTTCASGQSEMSVEGVEGIFCVSGQSCVADIDGSCPGEQTGLPYGSYCGIVKTGVHGCMPYTEPQSDSDDSDDSCADGESPMSVEGVEGIFCVTGQACVADINGTCPGVQDGLPYGSSCGIVKTGVHGCKPNSRHHHHHHHKSHHKGTTCASGQSEMSVEGVEGIFCVSGQSCVADIDGSCPGEQTGLPYGSYCGIVKTGVHGCMPYTEPQSDSDDSDDSCADGESPMSVEGVEGIFCVTGQACVADINGTCPGVQDGLPYGSSCGIVKTGVHGCKPNNALHHRKHKSHHDQY